MVACNCLFNGLTFVSASEYQMLRTFVMFSTLFLSVYVLKRNLELFKYVGVFLIIIGVITVGLSGILEEEDEKSSQNGLIGFCLITLACIFLGCYLIGEETIVKRYNLNVFDMIFWEGFWGTCL